MSGITGGLVDVESMETDGGPSPPPPYHHHNHHGHQGHGDEILKTKAKWTSSANLALSNTKNDQQITAEVLRLWEEASSWKEFTNNTTFHGVKHIFEDSPFRIRRILWVLCFLTAVIFFIVQVSIRMADYYKYNTNVDVQVQYVTELGFPAVTICNQNSFRMTKVVNQDMYTFVDEVFANNIEDVDYGEYKKHDSLNTTEFLENAAHQLDDLVDSCSWNAERCDLASDFKKVSTDMGICYTFNHNSSDLKVAKEAGVGYGLRLILNVEQYEAMRGPQNDAGLKLLLHSPDEFPLLKDMGFSVAPGTHTLVGVYYKQINSLEPPWGKCSSQAQPMSTCKKDCKMKMVERKCNCVDAYMKSDDCHVCPLTELWGCVRNVTEKIKPTGDRCNCSQPCQRNMYEPRLSYAQLSRINIDRMVLKNTGRKVVVEETFENALETLQRVDATIAEKDRMMINKILEYFEKLSLAVHEANLAFGSNSSILTFFNEGHDAFEHDLNYVEDFEDYFDDLGKTMNPCKVDLATYTLAFIIDMFIGDDIEQQLQRDVQCVQIITLALPLDDDTDPHTIVDRYMSGMSNSNWSPQSEMEQPSNDTSDPVQVCNSNIKGKIQIAQQVFHLLSDVSTYSMEILDMYNNLVNTLYTDSGKDPASIPEHSECIRYITEDYIPRFVRDLNQSIIIFDGIRKSTNKADLQNNLINLIMAANNTEIYNYVEWFQNLKSKCFWIPDVIDSNSFENQIESGEKKLKDASSYFSNTKTHLTGKLQGEIEDLQELVTTLKPYMNITSMFLKVETTKLNMANKLTSMDARRLFTDLLDVSSDYQSEYSSYVSRVESIESFLIKMFEEYFSTDVPVITETSLKNYKVLEMVKGINMIKVEPLTNTMVTAEEHNLPDIFNVFKEFCIGPEEHKENVIGKIISELTTAISTFQSTLQEYEQAAVMDQSFLLENFLQVDIFYSELSYDMIEQHRAFELVSLFSEVGGFLGLLLGASVLSVIEFLDYIGMLIAKKMRNRSQVKNNTTKTLVKPFKSFS